MEKKKKKESGKNTLLKDNVNNILDMFDLNFTNEEVKILKKLAGDERRINYINLLFKAGNPGIKNFDFLKRFNNFFDWLIDLLNEKMSINKWKQEQQR